MKDIKDAVLRVQLFFFFCQEDTLSWLIYTAS